MSGHIKQEQLNHDDDIIEFVDDGNEEEKGKDWTLDIEEYLRKISKKCNISMNF